MPSLPWLKNKFFGKLEVRSYLGKNSKGEKVYGCLCDCGEEVKRTEKELNIRRLQRCQQCRIEYVEETLEQKQREISKQEKRKCLPSIN